ncbi:carboxypeptidase-like regulatory domain-containing protein [bacterium]|nr:carboxypeptidase-like regulatory domain-containing protein [bacterium]
MILTLLVVQLCFTSLFGSEQIRITLQCTNIPLKSVLKQIARDASVNFVFRDELIQGRRVSCQFTDASVDEILKQILPSYSLSYRWTSDNVIVLFNETTAYLKIKGVVRDAENHRPLPYANIILSGTKKGSTSDNEGYFQIDQASADRCSLKVSYIGYDTEELVAFASNHPELLEIVMRQNPIKMKSVTVTGNKIPAFEVSKTHAAELRFSPSNLESIPSFCGSDYQRSMQMMPGVNLKTDNSADLSFLGSERIHNLCYLDGIPVCYRPEVYYGMITPFHAPSIEEVNIYKGGYSVQYGDCIGGIIELTANTMQDRQFDFGIGVNFFDIHGFIQIPVVHNIRCFFSVNRSFNHISTGSIYNEVYRVAYENLSYQNDIDYGIFDKKPKNYRYSKALGKLVWEYCPKGQIQLTGILGNEYESKEYSIRDEEYSYLLTHDNYWKWQSRGISLNVSHQWLPWWYSKLTAVHSNELRSIQDYLADEDFVDFEETGYDTTFDDHRWQHVIIKHEHQFQFGSFQVGLGYEYFRQRLKSNSKSVFFFPNLPCSPPGDYRNPPNPWHSDEAGKITMSKDCLHFEGCWRCFQWCRIRAGLRAVKYRWKESYLYDNEGCGENRYDPDLYSLPRFSINLSLSDQLAFNSAWGKYVQFFYMQNDLIHDTRMSNDLWLIANDEWPACEAEHFISELSYSLPNYRFGLEWYSKKLSQLSVFEEDVPDYYKDLLISSEVGWRDFFYGSGSVRGMEGYLQKTEGVLTGWICYRFGKAEYRFPNVNDGKPVYPKYYRDHELKATAMISPGQWRVSAAAVYGSPILFSGDSSSYAIEDGGFNAYDFSLPSYFRLDVNISRKFENLLSLNWELGVSFINVLKNRNVVYRYYYKDSNMDYFNVYERRMLPFLPLVFLNVTYR